jgi:hypothetical protein
MYRNYNSGGRSNGADTEIILAVFKRIKLELLYDLPFLVQKLLKPILAQKLL